MGGSAQSSRALYRFEPDGDISICGGWGLGQVELGATCGDDPDNLFISLGAVKMKS